MKTYYSTFYTHMSNTARKILDDIRDQKLISIEDYLVMQNFFIYLSSQLIIPPKIIPCATCNDDILVDANKIVEKSPSYDQKELVCETCSKSVKNKVYDIVNNHDKS